VHGQPTRNGAARGADFVSLQCAGEPSRQRGGGLPHQLVLAVGGEHAPAASLEDILRSKEEAGREKDVREAVVLRRFVSDGRD
jgi:hypothetical protein